MAHENLGSRNQPALNAAPPVPPCRYLTVANLNTVARNVSMYRLRVSCLSNVTALPCPIPSPGKGQCMGHGACVSHTEVRPSPSMMMVVVTTHLF